MRSWEVGIPVDGGGRMLSRMTSSHSRMSRVNLRLPICLSKICKPASKKERKRKEGDRAKVGASKITKASIVFWLLIFSNR